MSLLTSRTKLSATAVASSVDSGSNFKGRSRRAFCLNLAEDRVEPGAGLGAKVCRVREPDLVDGPPEPRLAFLDDPLEIAADQVAIAETGLTPAIGDGEDVLGRVAVVGGGKLALEAPDESSRVLGPSIQGLGTGEELDPLALIVIVSPRTRPRRGPRERGRPPDQGPVECRRSR